MKYFTPSKWISRIMVSWGIVTICTAAVSSYTGLIICRIFLGIAEAGFFVSLHGIPSRLVMKMIADPISLVSFVTFVSGTSRPNEEHEWQSSPLPSPLQGKLLRLKVCAIRLTAMQCLRWSHCYRCQLHVWNGRSLWMAVAVSPSTSGVKSIG
jgi:hypothetical protein